MKLIACIYYGVTTVSIGWFLSQHALCYLGHMPMDRIDLLLLKCSYCITYSTGYTGSISHKFRSTHTHIRL